jgi:hypothetical protein
MSKVCRALEALGFTTKEIVDACGGDACTDPILAPVFQVVYVGRRKFLAPEVLTDGPALLSGAKKEVAKKVDTSKLSLAERILAEGKK